MLLDIADVRPDLQSWNSQEGHGGRRAPLAHYNDYQRARRPPRFGGMGIGPKSRVKCCHQQNIAVFCNPLISRVLYAAALARPYEI